MGLLDDAIREHLELKRRHGADLGEVARQEQEALGPARRGPEPLEVAQAPEATEAPAPPHEGEEPVDPALLDPQVDAPEYREPEVHHGAIAASEAEPVPEPAAEAATPERTEAAEPPPAADVDWEDASQPTVAFDAADIEEAQRRPPREPDPEPRRPVEDRQASPERDEDVLEETPDFLQETPEHDRLWFEQRPPRDFDFDG